MFGDRLRLARARVGLSLRDLSAAIDGEVSPQAIGKYEAGEMMPSAKILVLLAKKTRCISGFFNERTGCRAFRRRV